MYKNYIKFLATSVIILGGGVTALNNNCYCMEDIDANTINEINTTSKYNANALVQTSKLLFTDSYYYLTDNKKLKVQQMIEDYINNIRSFYTSNDKNTLNKLIKLVDNVSNHNYVNQFDNMAYNIMHLYEQYLITTDDCEELLKFNLFLSIIVNIQNADKLVWPNKDIRKSEMWQYPKIIDGKQYYLPYDEDGSPYGTVLRRGTESVIEKLTKIFIEKNFILDDPKTWISKDILQQKIYMAMEDIINYFNKLPITKEITNTCITTSNIPVSYLNNTVNNAIEEFFSTKEVRNRLVHELTLEFQAAQANRSYQKMGLHSKEIGKKVFSYLSPEAYPRLGNKLIKDINVLKGLFNFPDRIPAIVLSYLRDDILDGKTWIVPKNILEYIKKHNILSNTAEEEDPFKNTDEEKEENIEDRY